MITDTFASVIVDNARLKPASIATRIDLPENTSSLKRSKIRIFASTATPMDKIIPAIPGNVIVALKPLPNTSNKSITYTSNAILATMPEKRYKITKKIMIIAIPALKATTDLSLESCPKEGPTVRTSNTLILTGNAPERNKIAKSLASSKL